MATATIIGGFWLYEAIFAPTYDLSYFCGVPDPSPALPIAASMTIQNCAGGRTFMVARQQTVAVDLTSYTGVDRWSQWTGLTVSDGNLLTTISGPTERRGTPAQRVDQVAIYRAARNGVATISAIEYFCGEPSGPFGNCDRGHRWSVMVKVS